MEKISEVFIFILNFIATKLYKAYKILLLTVMCK